MAHRAQGDDEYGYEKASERWTPIHTVETILISVISMLSDPNDESPANLEAAVPPMPCSLLCPLCLLFTNLLCSSDETETMARGQAWL
jgi:hypothetical protein